MGGAACRTAKEAKAGQNRTLQPGGSRRRENEGTERVREENLDPGEAQVPMEAEVVAAASPEKGTAPPNSTVGRTEEEAHVPMEAEGVADASPEKGASPRNSASARVEGRSGEDGVFFSPLPQRTGRLGEGVIAPQ